MPDSYDSFLGLRGDMTTAELAVFKRLFLSGDGQFVLGRILERCKFLERCDNERDMALNNFAKELIATVYWDPDRGAVKMYRIIAYIKKKLTRKNHA